MKHWYNIYSIAFFAVCALPVLCMPLSEQDTEFEKRADSAFPSLFTESGCLNSNFGTEAETWLSEHFAFRAELVTLNNKLHTDVLGVSAEETVIQGKDDWLFLAETMDDYTGTAPCTARELHNMVRTLSLMEAYAQQQGAEFLFVSPPNKATLYGEYLPYWYQRGAESNLSRLTQQLQDEGVSYLDLTSLLSESDMPLYHKRDSHWTNAGARLAYDAILTQLGMPHDSYADAAYTITADWTGDLDGLGFPTLGHLDEQVTYETDFSALYQFATRQTSVEASDLQTVAHEKSGAMLMFRDSFGNALIPFVSSSVGTVRYQKYVPYQLELLEDGGYDAVVIELVERNLLQLIQSPPLCAAQVAELPDSCAVAEGTDTTLRISESGKYLCVSGAADPAFVGAEDDLYLLVQSASGSTLYAAYPCEEYGYCVYLPSASVPEDAVFVPVVKRSDGYVMLNTEPI